METKVPKERIMTPEIARSLKQIEDGDEFPEKAKKWKALHFLKTGKTFLTNNVYKSEDECLEAIKMAEETIKHAEPNSYILDAYTLEAYGKAYEHSHYVPIPIKD